MRPDLHWLAKSEGQQLSVVHDCVPKLEIEALVNAGASLFGVLPFEVHIEDQIAELRRPESELLSALLLLCLAICLNHLVYLKFYNSRIPVKMIIAID